MKTQIITMFTALVLVAGAATTTFAAAPVKTQNVTVLTDISAINKIEVHGNVELYVSDGNADQVKVYNKYYAESALVQSKNGVLVISSYKAEKLVVWVTANDLRSISAYDNSEVKSFGDLSKIELNVDLHDNATAKLSLDAFTANVTVNDQAKASLSGTATEYDLKYSNAQNVNQADFKAMHTSKMLTTIAAAKSNELDNLVDL